MTRVEKFHRYREEIANMKVENNSSKKITSDQIESIIDKNGSKKLNYDEIITAYNIEKSSLKVGLNIRLTQILYWLLACIIIGGLIVLLIVL